MLIKLITDFLETRIGDTITTSMIDAIIDMIGAFEHSSEKSTELEPSVAAATAPPSLE